MAERQAVVFIHGIGEQRPVDSLRGFMGGLFPGEGEPEVYTMPDRCDTTFELQVFVAPARAGRARRRTDFYEGYWASEIRGTRVAHVTSWLRRLLLRWPASLPRRLRWLWWLVWVAIVLVAALAGWLLLGDVVPWLRADDGSWRGALVKLASGVLIAVATGWITRSLGDAVRYVDARPENVAVRRAVRTRIVELLERLHEQGYARIVVVGHSLGGIIAYDAIRLLWARRMADVEVDIDDAGVVAAAEALADDDEEEGRRTEFQDAQHGAWAAVAGSQRPDGHPTWRISDLVTVGSPIAYPTLLLAGPRPLHAMVADRELPTCPPVTADRGYRYVTDDDVPHLHHAAPFAVVRWTNVYAVGDFIGGPIEVPLPDTPDSGLGGGVRNEPLNDRWARVPLRAHSRYWDEGVEPVRRALSLDDDVRDLRRHAA